MKMNFCYIYIKRNWGDGYGGEATPFGIKHDSWRSIRLSLMEWIHSKSKQAADEEFKCLQQRLVTETGVSPYYKGGHISNVVWPLFRKWHLLRWHFNCYVAKFDAPDRECTDPLGNDRNPRITVYLIFEGCPQTLPAARFDLFVKKCLDVAFTIKSPGTKEELKVPIPNEFFNTED